MPRGFRPGRQGNLAKQKRLHLLYAKSSTIFLSTSNRDIAELIGVDERTIREFKTANGIPQLAQHTGEQTSRRKS